MYKKNDIHAFTLLEIMLVVMIIAILAGAAIHLFGSGTLTPVGNTTAKADIQAIRTLLLNYQLTTGSLPTTEQGLAALVAKPTTAPVPRRWLKVAESLPRDPWQREYYFRNPGEKNRDGYDLFSAGKDGTPGNEDDIGNWE